MKRVRVLVKITETQHEACTGDAESLLFLPQFLSKSTFTPLILKLDKSSLSTF
jgi:hypothetical protein